MKGKGVLSSVKKVKTKFLLLFSLLVIVPVVIGFALANVGYFPAINFFGGSPETAGTTVFVYPSKVKNDTLQAGSTFTIYVNVSDASDLFAWQVNMSWNPSILNVSRIIPGEFLARSDNQTSSEALYEEFGYDVVINSTDNAQGHSSSAESILADVAGISGNGTLVSIEFLVVGYGYTNLTINVDGTFPTRLLDSAVPPNNITFTTVDCYFSNKILSDIRGPDAPSHPPDGEVDMWDFGFFGLAYGKTSADLDWDDYKIADIRGPAEPDHPPDGVVDMWDFGYAGLEYGSSIWP